MKATESIELECKFCIEVGAIRLKHPRAQQSEEDTTQEKYREERQEAEMYGRQIDVL